MLKNLVVSPNDQNIKINFHKGRKSICWWLMSPHNYQHIFEKISPNECSSFTAEEERRCQAQPTRGKLAAAKYCSYPTVSQFRNYNAMFKIETIRKLFLSPFHNSCDFLQCEFLPSDFFPFHVTSFHVTSFHVTSFHMTSFHMTSFHMTSFIPGPVSSSWPP